MFVAKKQEEIICSVKHHNKMDELKILFVQKVERRSVGLEKTMQQQRRGYKDFTGIWFT